MAKLIGHNCDRCGSFMQTPYRKIITIDGIRPVMDQMSNYKELCSTCSQAFEQQFMTNTRVNR
jgi:hypothetical protein